MKKKIALKVDVDTDRGTRVGVQNLLDLFEKHQIKATFLFSLGPDNTGRALKRVFQPGFFKKVSRTSVLKVYGLKTLMNGVLWPGPDISKRNRSVMLQTHHNGHEVGVHTYDHIKWQNQMQSWDFDAVKGEMYKSYQAFIDAFGFKPKTYGAAGWQMNENGLKVYEDLDLSYASDTRGSTAFFPLVNQQQFKTLQVPTTLPTLDELLGRPEYPLDQIINHYEKIIEAQDLNVLTLHAELEGMAYLDWFDQFLTYFKEKEYQFIAVQQCAIELLFEKEKIPSLKLVQKVIDGRGGEVASHQ